MSLIMNNVECTGCDFFEEEAIYRRADGPDNCPECGSKRKMSFKGLRYAIHGQGPGSFAAVDFGVLGKAETREDYDRCIATIEERFPGKRVHIQGESDAQNKRASTLSATKVGSVRKLRDSTTRSSKKYRHTRKDFSLRGVKKLKPPLNLLEVSDARSKHAGPTVRY